IPSEFNVLAAAMAFELSFERDASVSQNLLGHVSHAGLSQREVEKLPQEFQQYVQAAFARAFSTSRTHSNPLTRPSLGLKTQTYEEIVAHLEGLFPRRADGPRT